MRCALCKAPTCDKCTAPYTRDDGRYIGMICKSCAWKRATTTEDLNEMRKLMLIYLVPILNLFYYVVFVSYLRYVFKSPETWLEHYMEGMREARKMREPKPTHAYPLAFVAPIAIIIPLVFLLQEPSSPIDFVISFGYLIPAFSGVSGFGTTLVVAKTIHEDKLVCKHKAEAQSRLERVREKKKRRKRQW